MIPDCDEYLELKTNGPNSYYTDNGFVRDIKSVILNCESLYFPYRKDGDWYLNFRTRSKREKRGVVAKPLWEVIEHPNWSVKLASGT